MLKERRIKTTTSVFSDVGNVRKANEDSYFISKDQNLLIVCDGMGGQVAGGLASKIAVETIKDVYEGLSDSEINSFLYDPEAALTTSSRKLIAAIRMANRRIYKISHKFPKLRGMGTTVVALSFDKTFATMVHVGDSRIFRISKDKILQLTEDHSWLNELIEDQEINEEQIETFAQKNVITRALGTSPTVKIDIHCEKYKRDDVYILCTDGLHNSVGPSDMLRIYNRSKGQVEKVTRKLTEKALKRDGSDNITVAVAQINQDSKETTKQGVSTTIPEEGEKITSRIDKFIIDNYNEPQLQINKNPIVNNMNQSKFVLTGITIIVGLVCLLLGMWLQNANSRAKYQQLLSTINTEQVKSSNGHTNKQSNAQIQTNTAQRPIQRSILSKNAVMAFVLFNSESDFENAQLNERGSVLGHFYPYADIELTSTNTKFSIFLIDSSSNVLTKIENVRIPENPGR